MHHVYPSARSLRTLYGLWSDQLWFAAAVIAGLLLGLEVATQLIPSDPAVFQGGLGL